MLAVISARTFTNSGARDLREMIRAVTEYGEVTKVSSIYKIRPMQELRMRFGKTIQPLGIEGLVMVFAVETSLEPMDLLKKLIELESKYQQSKQYQTAGVHLLMYDDLITALPQITIPHPELHLRPEELVPAAEILPDYVHPVLGTTLRELARKTQQEDWGEFYAQGPSLVDFSKSNE